ncbi:MAG TPA: glutathione S-transferase family protein [Candidatus Omnitrophota bacterium]|nr:glutathione S-transferase family protein [Candidatus Omnitrophota bacterium]
MSDSMTLVIGTKRYSSWSLRPWLALKKAGAEFDEVEIALRQPDTKAEILKWSPSGKVPLLVHGDLRIWDSLAICEYVAETFPEAELWPAEREARAVARAISAEMHAGFPNLRNTCAMDVCVRTPLAEIPTDVMVEVERIKAIWNECRHRFGADGPFLFGRFSIADAMYAPVVTRFTTFAIKLDRVSKAYCDAVWDLPAMQEWKHNACA